MPTEEEEIIENIRQTCKERAKHKDDACELCMLPNHEHCWTSQFKCPICNEILIKVNIDDMDCAYQCFNDKCRNDKLEFPIFYGYNQDDINNNLERGK